MSRLPTVTPRQVVRALNRAGFKKHHQRGSHLYLRHPDTRRMTSIPMHPGDLPRGTLRAILRQVEITAEAFAELL